MNLKENYVQLPKLTGIVSRKKIFWKANHFHLKSETLSTMFSVNPALQAMLIALCQLNVIRLSMFFNLHEKNWEGLVDFGDIMDVV